MKRSAIARRTPLAPGKPPARRTRLAPVNRKRKAKAFARNFGERAEAVREMPCLAHASVARRGRNDFMAWRRAASCCSGPWLPDPGRLGVRSIVQAAHVRARGMGGAKGDRRDLVPLCQRHHSEAGEYRTSQRADFERRYGLDLVAEAARIAVELDERGLP